MKCPICQSRDSTTYTNVSGAWRRCLDCGWPERVEQEDSIVEKHLRALNRAYYQTEEGT